VADVPPEAPPLETAPPRPPVAPVVIPPDPTAAPPEPPVAVDPVEEPHPVRSSAATTAVARATRHTG